MNWAQLFLELLTEAPQLFTDVEGTIKTIHGNDSTGTKALAAAKTASDFASAVGQAVANVTAPDKPEGT